MMSDYGKWLVGVVLQLHQPYENVVEPGHFSFSQQVGYCLVMVLAHAVDLSLRSVSIRLTCRGSVMPAWWQTRQSMIIRSTILVSDSGFIKTILAISPIGWFGAASSVLKDPPNLNLTRSAPSKGAFTFNPA
jgi:hypothetical protein